MIIQQLVFSYSLVALTLDFCRLPTVYIRYVADQYSPFSRRYRGMLEFWLDRSFNRVEIFFDSPVPHPDPRMLEERKFSVHVGGLELGLASISAKRTPIGIDLSF